MSQAAQVSALAAGEAAAMAQAAVRSVPLRWFGAAFLDVFDGIFGPYQKTLWDFLF